MRCCYSARVRRAIQLVLALVVSLAGPGCGSDEEPTPTSAPTPTPEASENEPVVEPPPPRYTRALEEQLDLVPPDADAYLVIRDLRPLMREAHRVERVMAGPLVRAIPALAQLGGGTGAARLAQLEGVRELLALALAALDNAGVDLEQGLVLTLGAGEVLVMFAAEDLDRLAALARAGLKIELGERCRSLAGRAQWTVCALGELETLDRYTPADQGEALAARLARRLPGVELDDINLALSFATPDQPIDLALRTDPRLWELSTPANFLEQGSALLARGSAPALQPLAPGASFMWARVDPSLLAGARAPDGGALDHFGPDLLTGELCLGATDEPDGLILRAGVSDGAAARDAIEALARALPSEALDPAPFTDLKIQLDRASLEIGGERAQTIGATLDGEGAETLSTSLGLDLRARLWTAHGYFDLALGEVQELPGALARTRDLAPEALLASLPPTLTRALRAGELGLIMHMNLDHWQAPTSEAELDALLEGVAGEQRPDAEAIGAAFEVLAPWSSVSVWLSRPAADSGWLAHLSIVPFAAADDADEAAAAAAVLDAVLTGADAEPAYRELHASYPSSVHAPSYRARAGEAPAHHGAVGMIELALIGVLALDGDDGASPSSPAPTR